MRAHEPFRLAQLDPLRAANGVVEEVHARLWKGARRLGLILKVDPSAPGPSEAEALKRALRASEVYRAAKACADWAATGQGKPDEVTSFLRELRADLDGIEPGEAPPHAPDLSTRSGVLVAATAARLALAKGDAIDAIALAVLASVDERTVRAAVKEGTLRPLAPGRPMRFAQDAARTFLHARGVPGFAPVWRSFGDGTRPPPL
jgi:hypothetical protein